MNLNKLDHPNFTKMIAFQDKALEVKSDGSKVPIAYMVLELVEGGDLNSFV